MDAVFATLVAELLLAAQANGGKLLVALARLPARTDCRDLPDRARGACTGGGSNGPPGAVALANCRDRAFPT